MNQKNFVPRNSSFKDQLRQLLPGKDRSKSPHHHRKGGKFNQPMSAPNGKDGVDHINIFEGALTDLGKCLSHSSQLRFNHKLYGAFSNIESFWYYIRSEEHDDRVRKLTGNQLKTFADMMTPRRVKNFMAIILDANWQRVTQYPELKAAVKENTLPFECYSYLKRQDGIRQRPPHAHWMIPLFEEISLALKEDREPNLTNFLDDQHIGLYDDVFPKKETDDPDLEGTIVESATIEAQDPVRNPGLGALLNRPVEIAPEAVASVPEPVREDNTVSENVQVEQADTTVVETPASTTDVKEVAEPLSAVDAACATLDASQQMYGETTTILEIPAPVVDTAIASAALNT